MALQQQPLRVRPRRGADVQRGREPRQTVFTLNGRDLARLDRFLTQGARAALRAGREFEGATVVVDADGGLSVNAVEMTAMRL